MIVNRDSQPASVRSPPTGAGEERTFWSSSVSSSSSKRVVYTSTKRATARPRESSLPANSNRAAGTNKRGAKTTSITGGLDSKQENYNDFYTNNGFVDGGELAAESADLLQQRQQRQQIGARNHHDINSNNTDNDNDAKVRLLVTPPPGSRAGDNKRGSKQQQMAARSQIDFQRANKLANGHYHHYDYYTDSDLTSSQLNQANHFNCADVENVLLFATEHNNNQQQPTPTNQRQQTRANNASHRPANSTGPGVGRFVNYYPSWRRAQSPSSSGHHNHHHQQQHHQNYSFHVPLGGQLAGAGSRNNLQQSPQRGSSNRLLYQARYGFLAPATDERLPPPPPDPARSPIGGFKQSFKSRTIGHIPNMVGMSVEEAKAAQVNFESSPAGNNYEDFYEKSTFSDHELSKQFVLSEGNLLRASILNRPACDVRKSIIVLDEGQDNPFKPNTELSWEADMMVRLMRRGYPVKELPILVQTAKEVAQEKSNEAAKKPTSDGKQMDTRHFRRQASISELSSGKKVWANSLSRAKSMPKFGSPVAASIGQARTKVGSQGILEGTGRDSDSIDKLITSIEDEMSELLRLESVVSERKNSAKLGIEQQSKSEGNFDSTPRAVDNSPSEQTIKKTIKKQKTGNRKSRKPGDGSATKTTAHLSSETNKQVGVVKNRPARLARGASEKTLSGPPDLSVSGRKQKKRPTGCCIMQ